MPEVEVDIRPLKKFVSANWRSDSILKRMLAVEPDNLPAQEFLGKMRTWLAILKEETG